MKLSYLTLAATDPARNLAAEQYVFDALPRDRAYFLLWQNDKSVIVGRHQNTLAEVDTDYAAAHGIRVVRRLSGGGAVYHDLGNLNFTFIADAAGMEQLDFRLFCRPLVDTLAALGVAAEISGRNDVTVDGKKFSGNAQYIRQGRVMHHGTVLFDADLSAAERVLRVAPEKLRGRGVASVRSRITNLRPYLGADVTLSRFRALLLENVLSRADGAPLALTAADRAAIEALRQARYDTYAWNVGASPRCTLSKRRRFEGCGLVELLLTVERGVITAAVFQGDFFSLGPPEELARLLLGLRPAPEAYVRALAGVDASRYISGLTTRHLLSLLDAQPSPSGGI